MVRTNQGGSVLSFVIIGVIMVALLVGGTYVVHQQTVAPEAPAPKPETPQNQKKEQPQAPKKQNNSPTPKANSNQSNVSPDSHSNTSSELPQTGPTELFVSLLALGLLSGMAVSYVRSRRPELSL